MGYINKERSTRWPNSETIPLFIDPDNPISDEQKNHLLNVLDLEDVRVNFIIQTDNPTQPDHIRVSRDDSINAKGEYGIIINGQDIGVPGRHPDATHHFIKLRSTATAEDIRHELGHALGLFHEHQRSDAGTFIVLEISNIKPSSMQFVNPIIDNHLLTIGQYNYDSMMHYPEIMPNHSVDASQPIYTKTPLPVDPNEPAFLSPNHADMYTIKLMYGIGKSLDLGDVSKSVLVLKRVLDALDYGIGPFDIELDQTTLESVVEFHEDKNLGFTDTVTSATWNKLGSKLPFIMIGGEGEDTLHLGAVGPQVKTLQCILFSLGFDLGITGDPPNTGIDGQYGQRTGKALVRLKKDSRILSENASINNNTTTVDSNTRNMLSSLLKDGIDWPE